MNQSSPEPAGFRWTPIVVLAFVALWPLVGPAEVVLSLGALASIVILMHRRFRDGTRLLSREAWALVTALFFCFWLPEFVSAFDAIDRARAWREVLVDLRYLPFLWLVAISVATARGRRWVFYGIGVIALAWTLDGVVQAITGYSLGGANTSDRLSGIFGADNLKLGLVLATLAPFALHTASGKFGSVGWVLAACLLGMVILLAGSRASWIVYALVLMGTGWQRFGRRRFAVSLLAASAIAAVLAFSVSNQFGERIERTLSVLSADATGLDAALSGRLSIWRAAVGMIGAHPVNGVGIRGFRDAYPLYAGPNDFWLSTGQSGALHAHQIVLEILSETGAIGMLLWLMGAALTLRAWRWALPKARARAAVPGLALLVTALPLNTSLAFYSTFWGGVFLLLLALFAGSLFALDDDVAAAQ